MMDMPKNVRIQKSIKAAKTLRKLTTEQMSEFRKDRESGFTYKMLIAKYKIAKSTVSYIANNKTYRTI